MKSLPQKLIQKNPFLLAPMDAVTDLPFRELCEKLGASYTTSELTSIDALIRNKVNPTRYKKGNLKTNCVQLFGKNPDTFIEAAKKIENETDIIDVNFGCPSNTVTKNNAGAMLLKDPKNVGKIIEKLVKNTTLPITAKIRLGYQKTTYLKIAKEIEDAGAELITVHGRTAKQKYSGTANWDAIKELHEKLKIPVIGNGDIKQVEDIKKYLNSHCSALMIGRAAIGNPIIFKQFNHYHKTRKKLELDKKTTQKKLFLQYIKKLKNIEPEQKNQIKIMHQAMWFFKGIEGAKELRIKLHKLKNINKIIEEIKKF